MIASLTEQDWEYTNVYLEAVIVCVNYSDFLKITLPFNKHNFDNIVIATHPDDHETIEVCLNNNVNYALTTRMYEDNAKFNKGKALNDGIKSLNRKEWVLITDADMIMPKNLKELIEGVKKTRIYGTGRAICPTINDWIEYTKNPSIIDKWEKQIGRINIGVGFFQLIHSHNPVVNGRTDWYKENIPHCGRTDRKFWRSFEDKNRKCLKNMITIHLGDDEMGSNWYGRTTKKWN